MSAFFVYKLSGIKPELKMMEPYTMIREAKTLLQDGDLMVRLNRELTSYYIQQFNRLDKSYSHGGIVFIEKGTPIIYHIAHGDENPEDKFCRDSVDRFCNPDKNLAFAIFRYQLTAGELNRLKNIIHQWYQQGIKFDLTFNYNFDERMYCSEMISKALVRCTNNRIVIDKTHLTALESNLFAAYAQLPVSYTGQLEVVAIDNLYCNQFCQLVKRYQYEAVCK